MVIHVVIGWQWWKSSVQVGVMPQKIRTCLKVCQNCCTCWTWCTSIALMLAAGIKWTFLTCKSNSGWLCSTDVWQEQRGKLHGIHSIEQRKQGISSVYMGGWESVACKRHASSQASTYAITPLCMCPLMLQWRGQLEGRKIKWCSFRMRADSAFMPIQTPNIMMLQLLLSFGVCGGNIEQLYAIPAEWCLQSLYPCYA